MFEVLIVDDEPYIRDALRRLVDWQQAGFRIAGEAINGREALEFLRRRPAALVFTDIRMPVMNGLELIAAARREGVQARFVVLSAYDEFHLVKDSFKLGAIDYILKSELEEADLLALLVRCREALSAPHAPPLLALDRLWGGAAAEGKMRPLDDLQGPGFRLREGPLCALVIRADASGPAAGAFEPVREAFESRGHGFFLTSTPGEWAVVCSFAPGTNWGRVETEIGGLFDAAQRRLREDRLPGISAGASGPGGAPDQVPALFEAAHAALLYGFVAGSHRLVFHNHLPEPASAPPLDADGRLAALREALRRRDLCVFRDRPEAFTVGEARFSAAQVPQLKNFFEQCFHYLRDFVHREGLGHRPAIASRLSEYRDRLRLFGDLKDCNRWLKELLELLGRELCGKSRLVQRAMSLVSSRLEEGVGLAEVARETGVSAAYLSRVFSREAGVPFVAYLTRRKMERAAEHLVSTDLKVYEIAEKLGYDSPEHFTRVFKKLMGKSPREFQRAGDPAEPVTVRPPRALGEPAVSGSAPERRRPADARAGEVKKDQEMPRSVNPFRRGP